MLRFIFKKQESIFLALIMIIATNCIASLTAINEASYIKLQNRKVCRTATCKKIASSILQNMDPSVNPCDNFYQFVCGNFTKNTVLPEDRSTNEFLSQISDKVQERLKTSIEDGIMDSDPQSFKLLQSYYNTCMEAQVEKNSENEFREILKNLGGWPVLAGNSWNESSFDWKETMYKFRETGYSFDLFVNVKVFFNLTNNTRKLLYLNKASLGIDQRYLTQGLKEKVVEAYYKFMVDFAKLFGADPKQIEQELAESLNFEIELSKISLPNDNQNDTETEPYYAMTIEEVQNRYPYISWLDYLNKILSPSARVEANETVMVWEPLFLKQLPDLLARTSKRTLANYAFWRLAQESAGQLLSERVQNVYRQFGASTSGKSATSSRWRVCVDEVSKKLPLATGALYARRHFDSKTRASALEMIQNIRETFKQMLTKVDWMDQNTKAAALEKLSRMLPLIAYPDELLDNEKLDEYHKDAKVYPESFLKSVLSLNLFGKTKQFEKFMKPVVKPDWTEDYGAAAVVNAYYIAFQNSILFPAGILQEEFFNTDNPKYINYAGVGSIVSHELTHGFDDAGRRFDGDGNMVNWWDPEVEEEYLEKTQCIVDQYSNYTVKEVGLKLNGLRTQNENIADNGGIKEAYFAYIAFEKKNGTEPRLPGLESYTTKQMFWIANAHLWCAKYRPEYLKNMINTDTHTPSEYRVNGPISNMLDFSKDFKCPANSVMNPTERCTVW